MVTTISFKVSDEDHELIKKIIDRAEACLIRQARRNFNRMQLLMDITACHANGCPLDLAALLNASRFEFIHDVFGIRDSIDRTTGQLQDCFLPRYAKTGE